MLDAGYPMAGEAGFAGLMCRQCTNLLWFLFMRSGLLQRGGSLNLLENAARGVLQRGKPWLSPHMFLLRRSGPRSVRPEAI